MAKKNEPRSTGYRVWHCFGLILAALYLLGCLTTAAVMRYHLKTDRLVNQLAAVQAGNMVAEQIRTEYVTDPLVTNEDVAEAVNQMEIPAFLADRLDTYFDMLRGDTDKVVQISVDEIIQLLEDNEDDLHDKCMLIIEDSDKQAMRNELTEPLNTFNKLMDTCYGSPALRALARFRVSIFRILLDIVLLALVLWRWMRVCLNSGKTRSRAIRGMGITVLIPSSIATLISLIPVVGSLFAKDGAADISACTKAIFVPNLLYAVVGVLCGALMIVVAKLLTAAANAPKKERPVKKARQAASATVAPEAPAEPTHCIHCQRALKAGAKFCIYCGKSQEEEQPAPAADESVPQENDSPVL